MKELKLGQVVYCSDGGDHWYVSHFAGMLDGQFTISSSLPDALNGKGFVCPNCLSVEDYHKIVNAPKDKDLVEARDDHNPFARSIRFYDAKNTATFYSGSGKRNGSRFSHYKVIQDWRNKPDFKWAVDVFESLED